MGQVNRSLLDLVRIPHRTVGDKTFEGDLQWAGDAFMKQRIPVALLITKGVVV